MVFWVPEDFQPALLDVVGKGRCTAVWKAKEKRQKKFFALKVYSKNIPEAEERALNEATLLLMIQNGVSRAISN